MGKILAFLGILVVGGALVVWKLVGKVDDDGEASINKEAPVMPTGDQPWKNGKMVHGTQEEQDGRMVSTRVSYKNPAGDDEVGFTLTVNGEGTIVATATDILATHDISKKRQEAFAAGLTASLSGKKLSDLASIDKVGGSSLTTGAFNQALPQLKAQL